MSNFYSAFSNSIRVKILICLSDGEKRAGDLEAICGLSQSAVSQHLTKLTESGLLSTRKEGREVYYSLINRKSAKVAIKLAELEREIK